jgi:hypothetical protein
VTIDLPPIMPGKRDEVMVAEFDTELVVLVPGVRMAHHLDAGLSLVLDSCDGKTPTADVIAEVAEATGNEPEAVSIWLCNALDQLAEREMLTANETNGV